MSLRKSLIGILCAAVCAPVVSAETDNGIRVFNEQEMTGILDKYFAGIAAERLKGFVLTSRRIEENGRYFYYSWIRENTSRGTVTHLVHTGYFSPFKGPDPLFDRKMLLTSFSEYYVDCAKRRYLQLGNRGFKGVGLLEVPPPFEAEFSPFSNWYSLDDFQALSVAADKTVCGKSENGMYKKFFP